SVTVPWIVLDMALCAAASAGDRARTRPSSVPHTMFMGDMDSFSFKRRSPSRRGGKAAHSAVGLALGLRCHPAAIPGEGEGWTVHQAPHANRQRAAGARGKTHA